MQWTGSRWDGQRPQGFSESQSQSWTTHVAEAIWLVGSSANESSSNTANLNDSRGLYLPMSREVDSWWQTAVAVVSLVAVQTLLVLVIAAWMGF